MNKSFFKSKLVNIVISFALSVNISFFGVVASAAEEEMQTTASAEKIAYSFSGRTAYFPGALKFSSPPGKLAGQYTINHVYPICSGEKDFDCIVNVDLISTSGKAVSGKFLEYIPAGFKGEWASQCYSNTDCGNTKPPYYYPLKEEILVQGNSKKKIPDGSRSSIWTFPGLSHNSGNKYLVSAMTNSVVTNRENPYADNSVADWLDSNTLIEITPVKVDSETSGLEISREIFEKSADGKISLIGTEDSFSKYGVASNLEKVCYASLEKDKPNCFSKAEDTESPRFKVTLRLKQTADFLRIRHWFIARASGIKVTTKKESDSFLISFEGTTTRIPRAAVLLPRTIEAYKNYLAALNKAYSDSGVTNKPYDLNDLSGFPAWQNVWSSSMEDVGPGSVAFIAGIEPYANFVVNSSSLAWSFETANISGKDVGWLWPCVKNPHVSGAIASNAAIMRPSPPTWNAEKKTLDFRIASPHLNKDGTVANGFYNLSVSQEVASCLWGDDVSKSQAEVSVISDAGEKKIFVSATSSSDGYLNFQVSGFSYSVNTISIQLLSNSNPNAVSEQTVETNSVKTPIKKAVLKEIVCKKGATIKKLKVKTCPKGYVKK